MNLRFILYFTLIILVIYFIILLTHKQENFNNHNDEIACYSTCRNRQLSTLADVCPDKPECVGICVNQHTYTKDNISDEPLRSDEDIGALKNGQSPSDVISTNCGLCISNFYSGLKIMNDLGTECSQN